MQSILRSLFALSLFVIFSISGIDAFAQSANNGQRIYICNQGEATVSVLDVQSNSVIETIDLQEFGFSKNAKPHHAIADADGSHWYVTLIGENKVLKFNRDKCGSF